MWVTIRTVIPTRPLEKFYNRYLTILTESFSENQEVDSSYMQLMRNSISTFSTVTGYSCHTLCHAETPRERQRVSVSAWQRGSEKAVQKNTSAGLQKVEGDNTTQKGKEIPANGAEVFHTYV